MRISSPIFRKIGATLLGLLIIIYVGHQIYNVYFEGTSTQTAFYSQIDDTIDINAWVVREEVVIENSKPGVLSYEISDGERVTKNSAIANLYSNQDIIENKLALDRLEREILDLKSLISSAMVNNSSQNEITSHINSNLVDMIIANQNQDYSDVAKSRSSLQHYINQKSLITGEVDVSVFQNKIDELETEKTNLESVTGESLGFVSTPKAGHFLSYLDGYENSFNYDGIESITVADLNDVKKGTVNESAIGKVSTSFSWYVVAVIDEQQKIKLEDISQVYLNIASASGEQVPATIQAMNYDSQSGNYALVLKCNYSNAQLLSLRNETVQVVIKTYSGVLVNEKYIKFEDVVKTTTDENGVKTETIHENVKGVYIKYGEIISFVQIFSDITVDGYAVCKTSLSDEEKKLLVTRKTIGVYDEIVTEKVNVYDGKIVS